MKQKIQTKWGEAYVFEPGDEVVAWDYGMTVTGVVKFWEYRDKSWGGTVVLDNGEVFFPRNITCLRPLTKLEKALL